MIRARSLNQKHDRSLALVSAARRRLAGSTYEAVSIAQIAADAGISKASTFTYFATKEALFLEVITQELDAWFTHLDAYLPQRVGANHIANLLADSLLDRPVLRGLLAILHTVLEQNIGPDQLRPFKAFLLDRMGFTGNLLARQLSIKPALGVGLLLQLDALLIGVQHLGNPAPVVLDVLADPDLAPLRVDLAQTLRTGFRWLIIGQLAANNEQLTANK